jgi:Yip1 domain
MATTTPVVAAEVQEPINHIGRLVGVFFSPGKTFADIAKRPSWIAPVLVMSIVGLLVGFVMNQKVDWRQVASKRIEESSRASQLSAEQKEQQLAISAKISPPIAYCIGLLAPILLTLIVGGVMLGAFNLLGGAGTNYRTSMAIVSHAYFVTILSSLLFILILFIKPADTIDLDNPVATNIGALLPDGTAKWLDKLASAIDIFSFWVIALLGIGFAATNTKKLKTGSAIGIVLAVWAAYEVVRVGASFIFS